MLKLISLCTLVFLSSSCAIRPQFEQMCGFPTINLDTDQPPDGLPAAIAEAGRPAGETSYVEILDTSLKITARKTIEPARMLFLSGGGQNGAFGAGFLAEWGTRSPGGRLPLFDVVTGISTGAILSTWAFLGDGDQAAARYHIDNESRLLKPYVKIRNGKMTTGSYISLMKKGAIADLGPLREELRKVFTDEVLTAVATADRDRRLLVGAVDVDSGRAVAFDLKAMAERFHALRPQNPKYAAERERFRNCYAEAVLASSSAPLAARPVFIDNRMYVDGGLRFGVFDAALSAALARQTASRRNTPPQIYMIINGSQDVAPLCQPSDTTMECNTVANPRRNQKKRHPSWNFPDLALRSQDILANQVYRFSAADVANRNKVAFPGANNLRFARINGPELKGFPYKPNDAPPDVERKSCAAWHKQDGDTLNPVQFYPNYMDCVSAYGRSRARILKWFSTSPMSD